MKGNVGGVLVVLLAPVALALVSGTGCDPAPEPASSPSAGGAGGAGREPPIAAVWRSRCGACHVRVEPGTRTRPHLEEALTRHRKRVRLREDQWQDLVTFLAGGESTGDPRREP